MSAHTTSDDPNRYRAAAEVDEWKRKDPIARLKTYLTSSGTADDGFFAAVDAESEELAARVRRECLVMPNPASLSMFDHVYHDAHPLLDGERTWLAGYQGTLTAGSAGSAGPAVTVPGGESAAGFAAGSMSGSTTGSVAAGVTTMAIAEALNAGLRRAMEDDPKVLVMGEDVGRLGGVFRVTAELQKDFGEQRVIDTPLAESGIIGTAIGLALRGYRPVCEIQFDGFIFPASSQIMAQLAKMVYRSAGTVRLPVVVRVPFGGGIGAVEHHSESPEAYFAHTPGLRVVACANPQDAYWMIQQAVRSDDPVLFFEPKRRYWDRGEVDPSATPVPLHTAQVVQPGEQVTVAAYGPMVRTALDAATAAAAGGTSLEVVDLRSISPLDLDTLESSVLRTRRLVVVHEAPTFLGLGAEIAARITERCFYHLEAPVVRVGGFHIPYPPSRLEDDYLPDLDRVLDAVDRALTF
jgi:pyruvate dehydrogenase E1 component beta subunit